ncbi:MAG: hypothetical protein BWY91_03232 [bacterium ADurb.BinA028]|nr:MAG: hypothetical protein BWY91_03232 [bacterium ADurb.BinA028]
MATTETIPAQSTARRLLHMAATVTAIAARNALMRPSRNVSTDQTKRWNWAKNPEDPSGVPAMSAKPRTTPISPETTHAMPAATPHRGARANAAEARSGMATAARKNSPTVRAADTSWTVRTIGNPHRTTAPGSCNPGAAGAAAPPTPMTTRHAASATTPVASSGANGRRGRLSEAAVDMTPP